MKQNSSEKLIRTISKSTNHGVITRGALILKMDGKIIKVNMGDWYYVPAHVEHSAEFEVDTDEIEFWFHDNHQ